MIKKLQQKLSKDANLKELLSGSAITFVIKITGMLLGYILVFIISRRTGAEGVGFYNLMIQILTVTATILGLGMNISVLRYVGEFNNQNSRSKMHHLYRFFVTLVGPITILVGSTLYFGADIIANLLDKDITFKIGLEWVGISLPFFAINQISVEFIRGLKQLRISELLRSVLRPLILLIGILLIGDKELNKIDVVYLLVVSIFINSIISRISIWKTLKNIPKTNKIFNRISFLKTSMPMMFTSISSSLLVAMPVFFLDYFTSEKQVGIFSVAFRLSFMVSLILVIVNTIAAPQFAELYWKKEYGKLQKIVYQASKLMFWIGLVLGTVIILGGKFWLGFFGEEFISGYSVLLILTFGQFINTITGSAGTLLNMIGKQIIVKNTIIITMTLTFVGYFILTPLLGLLGVALMSSFGAIFANCILAFYTHKKLNIRTYYIPFLNKKKFLEG